MTLLLLGMAIGYFAMLVLTAPALEKQLGMPTGLALFCAGVPLTFALAIAGHEVGHLLAGRCAGLSPRFAHVGPITFTRQPGGWRLGWDGQQPWLGGRAVCVPRPRRRWQMALFLIGGPFANLGLGVAAAWLATRGLPALPNCWLGLFALHSMFFGMANFLPLRERRLDSDGL